MNNLDTFIRSEVKKPFKWGETDCAMTADRWVQLSLGFSPMSVYGRTHSGSKEASDWLNEPGGLAIAFNRVMRANGIYRTKEPRAGDLGLVFVGKRRLAIAIHAGPCWFSHDECGLIAAPLNTVWKAWRIECPL